MHLASPHKRPDLLVIAGEHSGDQHAAALVTGLLKLSPQHAIAAIGGPALKKCPVDFVYPLTQHAVVGLFEVLKNYGFFRAFFKKVLQWIHSYHPKAICLVDYPGFNLRLAQALKHAGLSKKGGGSIAVYYYIAPQIWAWKAQRRFAMAETLDSLATIFPFEPPLFADTSLPVTFVGHPLVQAEQKLVSYDPCGPLLLCPGSRKELLKRHLPVFFETLRQLKHSPEVLLRLPEDPKLLALVDRFHPPKNLNLVHTGSVAASCVLTTAGTISLHCALAGVPGVLAYKTHPITYAIAKRWVQVPYLGLPNLLLKRPMYPEFLQSQATPEALARALDACQQGPMTAQAWELTTLLQAGQVGAAEWLLEGQGERVPLGSPNW